MDLGLPSRVKWATCNIGAKKPEDFGDYFAWGESATKKVFTKENCITIKKRMFGAIIERNGIFTDAAQINWGESWKIPTTDNIIELIEQCTWVWTCLQGVKGMKVIGPNENYIFIPAAGCYENTHKHFDIHGEFYGSYWSSTPSEFHGRAKTLGFGLDFDTHNKVRSNVYSQKCYAGCPIRPVSY